MTAKQFFDAGKIKEAEQALSAYLREHPTDTAQRAFLFELLCFSGQYDRAEKQLGVISKSGPEAELASVLYYSALHAEKSRHELFEKQAYPKTEATAEISGTINGKPFTKLTDADPEIGARLEVFAAGAYLWIPFRHITSIVIEAPKKLRDTLWLPATVLTAESFNDMELGEVLIPVIYPFSFKNEDPEVWMGHLTGWSADDQGVEYPMGQKLFLADGEEYPVLEIRSIEFAAREAAAQ